MGSMVEYGLTTKYDSCVETQESPKVHNILLLGLLPDTLYHYRIVSTSSTNVFYSQDYTFKTDQILWEFGGTYIDFQLQDENKFYHQHAPEINENNILLYDNDNHGKPIEFSRVVKYQFDINEKSAIPVWDFRLTGENFFTPKTGDVNK